LKKLVSFLLFGFFVAMAFSFQVYAEESNEIVELYPYNQQACLDMADACTETKVGSSFWTWTYSGHRYHVVRGGARYVALMEDADSDGFISPLEIGSALTYNAFGALTINDTDETVVFSTQSGRADITSVVHRIYAYFDEDGVLSMFEDQVHYYYIFNEGDVENPDWRLATAAEKAIYDAAADEEKPIDTRLTPIRMALDGTNPRGYVVEPITWIQWTNADVNPAEAPVEDWSTIVEGDPNFVTLPAGWSMFSFSTFDRGTQNPLTTAFLKTLPEAMLDDEVDPMVLHYQDQPAAFFNLAQLDDDLATPGIQMVVDYQADFDLPTSVTTSWINMFNEDGKIVNQTEFLDYEVEISQDGVVLETIDFTYTDGVYVKSGPVTSVDSEEFGAGYLATFRVTNPEGQVTERTVDIVVGVMPPKFTGLQTRYVVEGTSVDLLEGIQADDGYGNDLTDQIMVTMPQGFNPYYVQPGTYTIELEFSHNVFFEGQESIVTVKQEEVPFELIHYNAAVAVNGFLGVFKVWSDVTNFRTAGSGWGSVMIVVAADGTLKERYDRFNWEHTTSEGTVVGDLNQFTAWQTALVLEPGEYVVGAHGSTHATRLRAANLAFGDPVTVQVGRPDFSYDIVTEGSYQLVVDDTTPPLALIVNANYRVQDGQFANVNQAILANVVAFDLNDEAKDLAMYVSNNGGMSLTTPGTYTVEVTVEDLSGNATSVSFNVTVVEAPELLTPEQVQEMIDEAVEEAINDLRDELVEQFTPGEDNGGGCLGASHATAVRFSSFIIPLFSIFFVLGVVFFKKRF
jgi:hypothetical protein